MLNWVMIIISSVSMVIAILNKDWYAGMGWFCAASAWFKVIRMGR